MDVFFTPILGITSIIEWSALCTVASFRLALGYEQLLNDKEYKNYTIVDCFFV